MAIFGLGAAILAIGLAYLSRVAMMKVRGKHDAFGRIEIIVMGAILVAIAALILLIGADKPFEAWLVESYPA